MRFSHSLLLILLALSGSAQGLLWKISGHGLQDPSYLFGTIHVADERVFDFDPVFLDAFASCDRFVMELDMEESSTLDPSILLEMLLPEGLSISGLLSPEQFEQIDRFMQENTGIGLALFDRVQPFFVSALMGNAQMGQEEEEFLDLHLRSLAHDMGKEIIGLESMREQLQSMQVIDYEEQATYLWNTYLALQKDDGSSDRLIENYNAGRLKRLLRQYRRDKMPKDLRKAILPDRNLSMLDRSVKLIQEKPCFIAVGALHLPGKKGLVRLLRKEGFKLNSIQ